MIIAGLRRADRLGFRLAVVLRFAPVERLRLRAARCRAVPKCLICFGVSLRRFLADGLIRRFLRCGFASLRIFVTVKYYSFHSLSD